MAVEPRQNFGADFATAKIRMHFTPFTVCKFNYFYGTFCHGKTSFVFQSKQLIYNKL